jgi:gamma-glutamyltranspeptidase/glutathione hydrolase
VTGTFDGAAVALTCTIEQEMGSAVVVPGAGLLMNNEMTDFSDAGTANEPAPFTRPRSSMDPLIVVRRGRPALAAGGAGGSTIIMGVVNAVLDTQAFGMTPAQAVDAPRIDDQARRS